METPRLEDSLPKVQEDNRDTPTYMTLHGFKQVCSRFFGFKDFPLIQHNVAKYRIRQMQNPSYPYTYFSISSIGLIKDRLPAKRVGRIGSGFTFDDLTNAMLQKAYFFPAKTTVEVHYVTNDLVDALNFVNRALVVIATGKLNFEITIEGITAVVGVNGNVEDFSLPRAERDNESEPDAMDLVITFELEGSAGTTKQVSKINNYGTITQNVDVQQ